MVKMIDFEINQGMTRMPSLSSIPEGDRCDRSQRSRRSAGKLAFFHVSTQVYPGQRAIFHGHVGSRRCPCESGSPWRRSTASDVDIAIAVELKNESHLYRLIPLTLRSNQIKQIQNIGIKFQHGSGAVKNHGAQLGSSRN